MPIKKIPEYLRPREKAYMFGIDSLNEIEVLALFLRSGTKGKDVLELSKELISEFGGVENILSSSFEKLLKTKGIGKVKALEICSISKLLSFKSKSTNAVKNTDDAVKIASMHIKNFSVENFVVIFLDRNNKIIYLDNMYKGTNGGVEISPREIASMAVTKNARNIICIHNHPSGDVQPSNADQITTKKLVYTCNLLGINLISHIVINDKKEFSLVNL